MAQKVPNPTPGSNSTLLRRKPEGTHSQGITSHQVGIAWSWFLVTVPIAALTAVFLVLVFHYRLYHGDPPFPNLRLPSAEDEKNVVYVDLSSSMILFTTSWASSVAPMLSSFVVALASCPIARRLSRDIQPRRRYTHTSTRTRRPTHTWGSPKPHPCSPRASQPRHTVLARSAS